jgi:hypothetical protein
MGSMIRYRFSRPYNRSLDRDVFALEPENVQPKLFWVEAEDLDKCPIKSGGPSASSYTHWMRYKLGDIVYAFSNTYQREGWTVKEVPVLEPKVVLTQ